MGKSARFAVLGLLFYSLTAGGATITFSSVYSGANEVPPTGSPGKGTISATINDVAMTLSVDVTFSGLTAPASAAHIHCCVPVGTNASVVLPFVGFPNTTSGTYSHLFNLTTDVIAITPAQFVAGFENGRAYANIHNAPFPGGEIRANLVPEPDTSGLLGLGVALLAIGALRRRYQTSIRL